MTNSPPTIKTPSSALLILSHSPVHTDTHTTLPPKLTKSCHSYSINPLLLKKSFSGPFPPQIMSLAISGYLHRQKNPPLSPSLICSTTRLESPQTGGHLLSHGYRLDHPVPGKITRRRSAVAHAWHI
ncbi:hypothetical protein Trisim1_012436 [Trichoderma cf. simile WF8]